jgi:hypothetical protein
MIQKGVLKFAVFALSAVAVPAIALQARLAAVGGSQTLSRAQAGMRIPVWSGGALVVAAGPATEPNAFLAYDRKGAVVFNAAFFIPGAAHTYVRGWARGADGTLALCGSSYASDGAGAPFIALISADTVSQHVIRTEPYSPNLVAVAADGTLWTVGYDLIQHSEKGTDKTAGVLRHFDRTGRLLGAFIPRSSFPTPVQLEPTSGYLAASADRVGWLHYQYDGDGGYVEIAADGQILEYGLPRLASSAVLDVYGMAIAESGDAFVAARDLRAGTRVGIFRLDRATKQWLPIARPSGEGQQIGLLYGASGSDLVFELPGDDRNFRYGFFRLAQ